jgi:tRNA 2-selenouridine synthase
VAEAQTAAQRSEAVSNEHFGNHSRVGVGDIDAYSARIDVRSPAEYAIDHLPAATNHPVLDDGERAQIGTLYASAPFAARRIGAALVARNIARMLEGSFAQQPRDWRPLVYCWRGGQRSRALMLVLQEIGWKAVQLDGGYRAWRRHVVSTLETLPQRFHYVVICGLTGSGKSRLLAALAAAGAQVLDLETLAAHRGSLLGALPASPQPSQKAFESALLTHLHTFDASRPVFVESESRRLGALQLPDALLAAMRGARTVSMETPLSLRIALLRRDYEHLLDARTLAPLLKALVPLHGKATIERWNAMAHAADWDGLVEALLTRHYDPAYARSLSLHYGGPPLQTLVPAAIAHDAFMQLAQRALEHFEPRAVALTR